MTIHARPSVPYFRQLVSGPTVVVRNGFLDLELELPDDMAEGMQSETMQPMSRTSSSPARLGLDLLQCFEASFGGDSDSEQEADCSCRCVARGITSEWVAPCPPGDCEGCCPSSRGQGASVGADFGERRDISGSPPQVRCCRCSDGSMGRWSDDDGRTTASDIGAASWVSSAPSSLSPPLAAAASPLWTSPVLLASLPPLALPEAWPQMLLPHLSMLGESTEESWAAVARSQQPRRSAAPSSQRSRRAASTNPRRPAKAHPKSPQLCPLEVPELAQGLLAEDPDLSSIFLGLAPPSPHSIATTDSAALGVRRVVWTVDAEKLRSHERQAVSPSFELPLGVPAVARLVIFPKQTPGAKGGASFARSRGWGGVHLKCEASSGSVSFQISISDGTAAFPRQARGPVRHDFAVHSICGLPKEIEYWDFGRAVNRATQTFAVCVDILPHCVV
mmetsp:Transcript_23640/g.67835  ORF Transcript_23640/g.67835 Transcript_23640/m.67835 type:complete len:447 (+) Transcript_23640:77-1417(+)